MRKIKDSSENEVMLSFLQGEYDSARFGDRLHKAMKTVGAKPEIILKGDVLNAEENELRREVMKEHRGSKVTDLFVNFPKIYKWEYVEFTKKDINKIYFINHEYWNKISKNTSKPIVAGKNALLHEEYEHYVNGAKELDKIKFPPIIIITCNKRKYLLIEGHSRMTAYGILPKHFDKTFGFVGYCLKKDMLNYDRRMVYRINNDGKKYVIQRKY